MSSRRARCALATVFLTFAPAPAAMAQDAFGLESGLSTGLIMDPLTGHSPWRAPHIPLQSSVYTGYASDPVYGCTQSNSQCLDEPAAWVQDDWMVSGDVVGHLLGGRLSVGGGVRMRAATTRGSGLPDMLSGSTTFQSANWEDLRLTGRWSLLPWRRLSVAPMLSAHIDRNTHIVYDTAPTENRAEAAGQSTAEQVEQFERQQLNLGPLYGLGNSLSVSVPIGTRLRALPLALTLDPEAGRNVSNNDLNDPTPYTLGLHPLHSWGRLRAGASLTPTDPLALLAEVEGRLRRFDTPDGFDLHTSLEARVGVRRSLLADQLSITALVGHSPSIGLGAPALRGGLSLRYIAGANKAMSRPAQPTTTAGAFLRFTVTDATGTLLEPEVRVDGERVAVEREEGDTFRIELPDREPHQLSISHPRTGTMHLRMAADGDQTEPLAWVLPPGGGDGVLTLPLRDPTGQPIPTFGATIVASPSGVPPFELGSLCGDCGLRFTGLPEGPYSFDLQGEGLPPRRVDLSARTTPPAPPDDLIFLAPPVGQLDVQVKDPTGQPIPGASLRLLQPAGINEVPLSPSGRAMPVVAPGRWLVESRAPGYGPQQHELLVQPLVPVTNRLEVTLLPIEEDDAQLVVEIFDAEGFPVPDARVRSGDRVLATTGTGGRVTINGLAAGPLELQIDHTDFRAEPTRTVNLVAGEERGASFALGWLPGAVVLRVQDEAGIPIDSVVKFDGPGPSIIDRTGPDGLYSRMLPPGDWTAQLTDQSRLSVSTDFRVEASRNTSLQLQLVARDRAPTTDPSASLRIRVMDESKTPVEGAQVWLDAKPLGATSTNGSLEVAGLTPGNARVEVDGTYFDRWFSEVVVIPSEPQEVDARLRSRLGVVELVAVDPDQQPIEAQVRVTGASGQTRLSRLGTDGRRSYRLATGYWEFAFASQAHGFGVEDLTIEREQAHYEVTWVGTPGAPVSVLAPPQKRPVTVQLWSRPADAPTPGTLRMLGPEVLPPFEVGADGQWSGTLRPGSWEALATAPELGIGGDDLDLAAGADPVQLRIALGTVEVELTDEEVSIDDTLYFALGSARVEPSARASLTAVARTLRSNPGVRRVQIEGHADPTGTAERNQQLSEERAEAVLEALVALGVERHRLSPVGYGASRPVATDTGKADARSRRVVFRVLEVQDAVVLEPGSVTSGSAP